MKLMAFIVTVTAIILGVLCQVVAASSGMPPLQPVQHVDLNSYVGLWYEIAHFSNKYQDGCQDSIVRFSLRNDGEIDILNSCRDKKEGKLHHADGRGWVIDKSGNARLKVSYFWPFSKEYVFIDQGKEYEYSVICTADRKNLWIISRSPVISDEIFAGIASNIEKQGFQRERLIKTEHIVNNQPDPAQTGQNPHTIQKTGKWVQR